VATKVVHVSDLSGREAEDEGQLGRWSFWRKAQTWRERIGPQRIGRGASEWVLKKSDLYSSLWKSCDELRCGMDAS
jgi:hypothetical protein